VTSITGIYSGSTITGLADVDTFQLPVANDNLVNTSQPLLDLDGIAFNVFPSVDLGMEGSIINLFLAGDGTYSDNGNYTTTNGTFTLTEVPEPATASVLAVLVVGAA
jgi:hypothetical protein